MVLRMAGVLCTSQGTVQLGDKVYGDACAGLYFGLHCSQGRALLLNALGLAVYGRDSEVCLYVCVEGDGAGREQQREAWREVARGTIKRCTVTRLALSSPVAVGDGATVAAAAVVNKPVPPGYTAVGVPAKNIAPRGMEPTNL